MDLQTKKARKNSRKDRIHFKEDAVESRAGDFLAAEKIQAASCSMGEKNVLLERFFDLWTDNFLDGQITGIGSYNLLQFSIFDNCCFSYTQVISKVGCFSEADAPNLKQAEPTQRRAPVGEGAQIRKAGGFLNLGGASREGFKFGDVSEAKMPSFESPWV